MPRTKQTWVRLAFAVVFAFLVGPGGTEAACSYSESNCSPSSGGYSSSSNYGAPSSNGYGAPTSTYGAPTSTYGAPSSSQYGNPGYGVPSQKTPTSIDKLQQEQRERDIDDYLERKQRDDLLNPKEIGAQQADPLAQQRESQIQQDMKEYRDQSFWDKLMGWTGKTKSRGEQVQEQEQANRIDRHLEQDKRCRLWVFC